MNSLVSIIIVTWNVDSLIEKCLSSIKSQSFNDYEVIVIDNGSTDNTRSILKAQSGITLIENDRNKGFACANNQGIAVAKGTYVFCLNSDVVLEEHCLTHLVDAANSSTEQMGIFSPKILSPDHSIYSSGIYLTNAFRFVSDTTDKPDRSIIWGANAAACLYKKKFLNQIKYNDEYFDNDFFFLVEDVDVSFRAAHLGYQTIYIRDAICTHIGNCSQFPGKYHQYLSFRNRYYLLIKNLTFLNFLKKVHYLLIYDTIRAIFLLATNKYTVKAIVDIVTHFQTMQKKRKQIMRKSI